MNTRIFSLPLGKGIVAWSLFGMVSLTAHSASAIDYTFAWAANPPPCNGYLLYYKQDGVAGPPFYGVDAGEGPSPFDIGNRTSFTITGLDENAIYHFALKAYDGTTESEFSATITVNPADTPVINPTLLLPIFQLLLLDDEGEAGGLEEGEEINF